MLMALCMSGAKDFFTNEIISQQIIYQLLNLGNYFSNVQYLLM